jgi:lipopolysaccharide heptosyltransferase III
MCEVLPQARAPRTLVIFPGALGDLICLVPALNAIARRAGASSVELMARGELARLAVGRIAGIARGHSIDRREVAMLFRGDAGASAEVREFFTPFARIYSFFAANDARFRRALAEAAGESTPVSFHPFRAEEAGHVAEGNLRSIDAASEPLDATVAVLATDLADASRALSRIGARARGYVLMLAGSGSAIKNWPPEKFVLLARRIAPAREAVVALGPTEANLGAKFEAARIPILRDLELGTVAAIARQAATFVGNDSGVSHLAAAAGARGVVLFGPTDPARWRPLGDVTVIRREPLAAIPVGEVLRAVKASGRFSA